MVKAGKMMWKLMTKANWMRDSRTGSSSILRHLPWTAGHGWSRPRRSGRLAPLVHGPQLGECPGDQQADQAAQDDLGRALEAGLDGADGRMMRQLGGDDEGSRGGGDPPARLDLEK